MRGRCPRRASAGLPGTKVEVFLRSNRPLRGGSIALWGEAPRQARNEPAGAGESRDRRAAPTEAGR